MKLSESHAGWPPAASGAQLAFLLDLPASTCIPTPKAGASKLLVNARPWQNLTVKPALI